MVTAGNVHSAEDREAWIGIQRKTFTRWSNQYLPDDAKINSLVEDLADGLVLSKLLAKISGENVGKLNKNPKIDIQKLENLNQCLDFIRKNDIQLVNIGSSDILKGNEKLILGLLWTIILRFEVAGADGKAGLLLWLQRSTKGYNGVNVTDFTSSWKDGLAFNALIHRYRPDLVDFDSLTADDAVGNCNKAFETAEDKLKIAKLLDAEDVVASPDEKSQVAYLSQFFKLFAGQAKLDAKLRAIKNAVEVTRRHDGWMGAYASGSKEAADFAEENRARLEQDAPLATTEEVKAALDAFDRYMKQTKPGMAAKRAEVEGIYSTLVSSKRNNNRPEFVPEVLPSTLNDTWEALEAVEQGYERRMLDKYLAYQSADHAVAKFNARRATVNTWLDEKAAAFAECELGSFSVPDLEALLEVHASYENRLALYEKVMVELEEITSKASAVAGHAGGAQVAGELGELQSKLQAVKVGGAEYKARVEAALAAERALVAKEKEYLHKIDNLDFAVDQLEELVNESKAGATVGEMTEVQNSADRFERDATAASALQGELAAIAQEIASRRPDAAPHCDQQAQRIGAVREAMAVRLQEVSSLLDAEKSKDELSKDFAGLANGFADFLEGQRAALGSLSGSLEDQRATLEQQLQACLAEGSEGATRLAQVNAAAQACDDANVVANPHTAHTIYSLRAQYEQLTKAIKRTDDAVQAQLMAQKALEIPAEQLKEIQEIFRVFDTDNDGKLRLADLKEACLGAGIDLEDDELESRMRARKADMHFTLDDFTAFFVEEVQTGDSQEDVVDAFKSVSGGAASISPEQIQSSFQAMGPDLAAYLMEGIGGGDYVSFTNQLFTR